MNIPKRYSPKSYKDSFLRLTMQLLPPAFLDLPAALKSATKRFKQHYPYCLCLMSLLLLGATSIYHLADIAIMSYATKLRSEPALKPQELDRIILISRSIVTLTLIPLVMVASYLPLHTSDHRIKTLFPQISVAWKAVTKGWVFALIRTAFRIFGLILVFCCLGLCSEIFTQFWAQSIVALLLSISVIAFLPSLSKLVICPWLSLQKPQLKLKEEWSRIAADIIWFVGLILFITTSTQIGIFKLPTLLTYGDKELKVLASSIVLYLALNLTSEILAIHYTPHK